jgi:hypothetical protein
MRRTPLLRAVASIVASSALVGADRDAIAPATNLPHREPMTGGGLAHLDVELGSGAIPSAQPLFFSAETPRAAAS